MQIALGDTFGQHLRTMAALLTAVADIAHTIQLSVAPVFLLAGIAGFLNMLTGRLARVVDRARVVAREMTPLNDPGHDAQVSELRLLDRRISYINGAILLCTASAIAICLVVAGLFIAALGHFNVGTAMAFAFIIAMGLLVVGLCYFLVEVRIAISSLRVPIELLEHGPVGPARPSGM